MSKPDEVTPSVLRSDLRTKVESSPKYSSIKIRGHPRENALYYAHVINPFIVYTCALIHLTGSVSQ